MTAGRPSKQTPEIIAKLEQAFAIGCSNPEACFFADVSETAFYEWTKADPKLKERFKALKNKPILKARQTVVQSLDDPKHAQWYLERKVKKEFSPRVENDISNSDGSMRPTKIIIVTEDDE